MSWLEEACELLATEAAIVRVAVAAVRGSTPREPGATMLVTRAAQYGTIGGGNLEWQAVEQARRLLSEGSEPLHVDEELRLGPDLAQCCGGVVTLSLERMPASMRAGLLERRDAQPHEAKPALWIFGAGHVGKAVLRQLDELPLFDIQWIDNRAGLLPATHAAHVRARCVPEPVELVREAPPNTSFLVLTHDHELDFQLCAAILARGDAAWAGLIGSQSKAARFRSRLRRAEFSAAAIATLQCPVGLTAIRSKLPAAIAVGIVAQLLALVTRAAQATTAAQAGCDPQCGRCAESPASIATATALHS
jgi:xanthine dehydrogenase accessory factor